MNELLTFLDWDAVLPWFLAVLVGILLLVCGFVLGRSGGRRRAAQLEAELLSARNTAKQVQQGTERNLRERTADIERLQRELDRARTVRYIDEFSATGNWCLRVCFRWENGDETHWLGVVETDSGKEVPFLTWQSMDALEAGQWFTVRNGVIVTTEPPANQHTMAIDMAADGGGATVFMNLPTDMLDRKRDESALPFLEVIDGPDEGKRFVIDFDRAITLGRDEHNTVALADKSASRVHAELHFDGRNFYIRDNQSTNKTYLKGQAISRSQIDLGDTIKIGATEMRFNCPGKELMASDPAAALAAFEKTLALAPEFLPALRNLAFLLERDIARKSEANAIWEKLARIEGDT